MSPFTNTRAAAATNPCAGPLFGFAALIAQNNDEFEMQRPLPTANGSAVRIGGWALMLGNSSAPSWHFGRYNNCNPLARCVGCAHICPAEDVLVDLSVRTRGLSVLLVEAQQTPGTPFQAHVTTFVPGRPHQSDVWTPILCPVTHKLHLVSANGTRMAQLRADGQIVTSIVVLNHADVRLGNIMFGGMWALVANAPMMPTMASPYTAGM